MFLKILAEVNLGELYLEFALEHVNVNKSLRYLLGSIQLIRYAENVVYF